MKGVNFKYEIFTRPLSSSLVLLFFFEHEARERVRIADLKFLNVKSGKGNHG